MGRYSYNVKLWYRTRNTAAVVCALALATPPMQARNRQGDKFLKAGQKAETAKNYDTALADYDQAVAADPNEPAYILAAQRMRGQAANQHIVQGRGYRSQGKLDEALLEFQKAFIADPSSAVALQSVRDTTAMIKQRNAGPAGTVVLTPAERARESTERRIDSLEGPPMLRPINGQISSLKMNNQPVRVLYESVGKLAGINVLMDPSGIESVAGKNFNLDLNNVTLEEALNYVALETHTFWKPISRNAIFVTQESDPKRQEYQDEVVKVFYIQNASTANEFTEIFNAVRTGARLTTGVFSVPSQSAIIARGSVDTMMLVEKLVHDLDHPKAEVVIDLIVMQVNKSHMTNIGASLLGQGGLTLPFTFTPRSPSNVPSTTTTGTGTGTTTGSTTGTGTTSTGTGGSSTTTTNTGTTSSNANGTTNASASTTNYLTLAQAGRFASADYSTSFPSTIVNLMLTDSTTRILQRPQVRSTDGGKASFLVGSSIPYVSGSLSSVVNTGGVPYATTQFQQVNVGTQIEFAPHVNGAEDISMHVKVELSNVLQRISIAGVDQPIIGKQTDEADIRMKDGEVSILGGLSDKEASTTLSGVPGVANIPVLGYVFGNKNKNITDNQILIAMIPHIVRAPANFNASDVGIFAGTERVIRVERHSDGSMGTMGGSAAGGPGATAGTFPAQPAYPAVSTPVTVNPSGTQPVVGVPAPSPLQPSAVQTLPNPAATPPTGSAAPANPPGETGPANPRTANPGQSPDPIGSPGPALPPGFIPATPSNPNPVQPKTAPPK